jgi:hypothetical protein
MVSFIPRLCIGTKSAEQANYDNKKSIVKKKHDTISQLTIVTVAEANSQPQIYTNYCWHLFTNASCLSK